MTAFLADPFFESWQSYERFGNLPASGGWLDQPLIYLSHFNVFRLVNLTVQFQNSKNYDMNKLNGTQIALVRWLENNKDG